MISQSLKPIELHEDEFPLTWKVLRDGVQEGVAPGFVVGVWRKKYPLKVQLAAHGYRCIYPHALPMTVDTIFDFASVSKVFATAMLAAQLVQRGWIHWNDSVSLFFPDYHSPQVQVRHLLSHTAGFKDWQPYWEVLKSNFVPLPLESISIDSRQSLMRKLIMSEKPDALPGVRSVYSDISFLLLGFILEEVTKMPLDQAVDRLVWQPMGIRGPYYQRVTQSVEAHNHSLPLKKAIAATEDCPWRGGILVGQVHDDNCWAMGGYGGHAGVFGTAYHLMQFSKALLEGYLPRERLHEFWTPVNEPVGCERTLGWDTPSISSTTGSFFSAHSVGHLGFTGTSLWIDPEAELAVTLLSNRVHPSRENWKIKQFRPALHNAIRKDLTAHTGLNAELSLRELKK